MAMRQPTRWMLGVVVLSCTAALCIAQGAGQADEGRGESRAWSPDPIEPGTYDDITSYNIFKPNRAALVADAERVPETPEDPRPPEPVVELPPSDPDASLLLVGLSVRGETPTAFIEDRSSGEIIEIDRPGEFSQGEITEIAYNKIVYLIDDETREVRVGYTLTGERAVAPPPSRPASGSSQPAGGDDDETTPDAGGESPAGDGLSDLERRMRERRNRE